MKITCKSGTPFLSFFPYSFQFMIHTLTHSSRLFEKITCFPQYWNTALFSLVEFDVKFIYGSMRGAGCEFAVPSFSSNVWPSAEGTILSSGFPHINGCKSELNTANVFWNGRLEDCMCYIQSAKVQHFPEALRCLSN